MKNIFLEFHARAITKIIISQQSTKNNVNLLKIPPPVLNQFSDNACVAISTAVALYTISNGNSWVNPREIYTNVPNSHEGMTFVDCLVYLLDNYRNIFEQFSFRRLFITTQNIKNALAQGFPIMVGYIVTPEIQTFHKSGDFIMPVVQKDQKNIEGHAVCLIGYNQNNFIALNSWGNAYGKNGTYEIPIENIHIFTDVYCFTPRNFNSFKI